MKVIFKVAQSSEEKPPRQTSINTARDKPTSDDAAGDTMDYKDVVRPIEDVRSFHTGLDQITKGRYDRYHYCISTQYADESSYYKLISCLIQISIEIWLGF